MWHIFLDAMAITYMDAMHRYRTHVDGVSKKSRRKPKKSAQTKCACMLDTTGVTYKVKTTVINLLYRWLNGSPARRRLPKRQKTHYATCKIKTSQSTWISYALSHSINLGSLQSTASVPGYQNAILLTQTADWNTL